MDILAIVIGVFAATAQLEKRCQHDQTEEIFTQGVNDLNWFIIHQLANLRMLMIPGKRQAFVFKAFLVS